MAAVTNSISAILLGSLFAVTVPSLWLAQSTSAQAQASETFDRRAAWEQSKQDGGRLVIWHNIEHRKIAERAVAALKMSGHISAIALPGLRDGGFMIIANGDVLSFKFDLEDALNGSLVYEALRHAKRNQIR